MSRRHYYGSRPRPPIDTIGEGFSINPASAAMPPAMAQQVIAAEDDESVQNLQVPIPFDYPAIAASPGNGKTLWLIGDGTTSTEVPQPNNQPNLTPVLISNPVPVGMRGVIDGIFPYVEGNAGPVYQPRIPGGVTITWSIFVNGRADQSYGNITTILAPWNSAMSERQMISLRPSEQFTCRVVPTDPNGVYPFLGIRIKGWFLPLKKELRRGR